MTLYELSEAMRNFDLEIDDETGEILNASELEDLEMQHDEKLKNCVYFYKNMKAEADALKAEKQKLADRQKIAERKAEWIKQYIADDLKGERFDPKDDVTIRVSWRKSESVDCEDISKVPVEYLRFKEPEVNKKMLKDALKAGEVIDGCELVTNMNIQIK